MKNYFSPFLLIMTLRQEPMIKVEEHIQQAGEKYVGEGNIPRVELCISFDKKYEKDKSCLEGSNKSCCDKE